ncbi:MAG: YjbQ family protein [Methanobacteriota archaeon]|nr:MAG: YjbQ family protein [Euryarchaeota archaeon]
MKELKVTTSQHSEFIDITSQIQGILPKDHTGIALMYVPHTTCGIFINEGADPDVMKDLKKKIESLVPWNETYYKHLEGNSAAHIKSIIVGNSVTVIVENGQLMLGTWERIFLGEFDGPRQRKLWIKIV